jgi:hypothetical protein
MAQRSRRLGAAPPGRERGLMSLSDQTVHHQMQPGPDTPLRLEDAVKHAFPFGGMTVSGLRREAARGDSRLR